MVLHDTDLCKLNAFEQERHNALCVLLLVAKLLPQEL